MGAIVPPTAQALRPAEPVETARVPLSAERVPPRVAIIGGGLAGLACAVGLAGRGLQITLYESRTRLGGRASSFNDPLTGNLVDNCQHVSMSCCTNLTDFCRRVGIDDLFKVVDQITFIDPEGRTTNWKSGPLPAPLHLAGAFAATRFLSLGDKLRIAFGLSCLRFARSSPSQSFYDWLRRHGQSTRTIKRFWETVLVSALNERLDQMDIGHARKVFLDGMMRTREGYRLEIPVVPLGELYGTRLESWLAASGVRLRMNTGVRRVELDDTGAVSGVRLRSDEFAPAEIVILAVPFDRVAEIVPEQFTELVTQVRRWDEFRPSPITGIHLWFDRQVCPLEHAVVVDRTIQWVFNHTRIQGRSTASDEGQYLQLVVSAAYDLVPLDKAEILDIALNDLRQLWPAAAEAKLVRSWVVTEHGATFSVRPGVDRIRPPARTPIDGLFLAGDWTATGWPATMEGAVRSGYRAAEEVTFDLGAPCRLVVDDLPQGRLARLLLGRPSRLAPLRPRSLSTFVTVR